MDDRSRAAETPISRRQALQVGALAAVGAMMPATERVPAPRGAHGAPVGAPLHVAVIGAGAFGGWAALTMLRRGAKVTLVDAWGAGHSRASSGDETRVIRAAYSGDATYTDMVIRARVLWAEAESRWSRQVFHRTGALYFFEGDDGFVSRSIPAMQARGLALEALALGDAARRWPQVNFDGIRTAYFEPEAGYLLARQSCELVREEFVRLGGTWQVAAARPGALRGGRLGALPLVDGSVLDADAYVFACGPWLGSLFPEAVGDGILPTRQDTIYLGLPFGDRRYDEGQMPVWLHGGPERLFYGIPGNERRGFKVADDTAGLRVDPTTLERVVSPAALARARAVVAKRFPGLANAPVSETRVCQYEFAPKGDFLLDRFPGMENVWLAGGGSGHGFKMGPAVGEELARLVLDAKSAEPKFSYEAFVAAREAARRKPTKRKHA